MTLVTAPLTWKQWFDLRWLDVRFLLLDIDQAPWWHLIVGLGLLVLATGTAVWLAGCARVASSGRPLAAILLACAGSALSISAVAVPIGSALISAVAFLTLGVRVFAPTLWSLIDDAVGWMLFGIALGGMGLGLRALRRAPRNHVASGSPP